MPTNEDKIIELVDDGTGTFVPSGKIERKSRKKKTVPEKLTVEDVINKAPQQIQEQLRPLMERQNFRGSKTPMDELLDGMEMGVGLVNRFMGIVQQLEKGVKVRR